MSTFRSVLRLMVLAGVCILSGTTTAEANPRRVYQPVITYYYPVVPSYSSGVYLYSQYPTVSGYYPTYPAYDYSPPPAPTFYYGGPYFYGSWGGSWYYPTYTYYGYRPSRHFRIR